MLTRSAVRRFKNRSLIFMLTAALAAVALFASATALAEAPLPPITGLASSSHPDPAKWYSNSYPAFHWLPAVSAAGPSWLLDRDPATTPDAVAEIGGLSFAAKTDFGTGAGPESIAVGDFNGDGKQDLATANVSASTASVLLGNGSGGFAAKADFTTTTPYSIAVGDFNGDGKQDLATANYGADTASVLLGNGDGTFAAKADFTTGALPASIAVGDFNGDGKQDLATANYTAGTASVLLGNGDGSFAAKTDFTTGTIPQGIAVGDFNGDGKQDLVTANYTAGTASVLLGDGSGGFAAKTDVTTGTTPYSIAVGDFNGDGKQDLVTANHSAGTASVLLGNGNGSFAAKTDFAAGNGPISIAVGDFNGDGKQDLATANVGASTASVLLGNGSGGFAAKTDFTTGGGPISIAGGDFNGDGKQDLATANFGDNTAGILLNSTPDAVAGFGPRADGVWYFQVCATDGVGGTGLTSTMQVQIDATAPTTRGLAAASVTRGGTAKLKYRVDDPRPGAPTAKVTIKIKNSRGKVVKTLAAGNKAVNTAFTVSFKCTFAKGKYSFFVYATDAAGNVQSKVGSNKLTVK